MRLFTAILATLALGSCVFAVEFDVTIDGSDAIFLAGRTDVVIPPPNEPWTGEWRVEGSTIVSGIWRLKQSGKVVKSTKVSAWKFEGQVKENQLEGKVTRYGWISKISVDMSSDGQSFEGTMTFVDLSYGGYIRGSRE